MIEKEADWLNKFYPSRIKGNAKRLSDTKRESDKMPVTKKESAMVRRSEERGDCKGIWTRWKQI